MKIRLLNLLLIGSIVSSVILSSCNKDDEATPENPDYSQDKGEFKDSRDDKTYEWVKIGDQIWMAENLAYTGSGIQYITDGDEWDNNSDYDGWCYYDNNENYGNTYGVLYQWKAAKIACPSGWHLPTDAEWTQLENHLIENGYSYDGVVGNEYIAKSLATNSGWNISDNIGAIGNSDFSEYRNKTGFCALPGGIRGNYGSFGSLGNTGSTGGLLLRAIVPSLTAATLITTASVCTATATAVVSRVGLVFVALGIRLFPRSGRFFLMGISDILKLEQENTQIIYFIKRITR